MSQLSCLRSVSCLHPTSVTAIPIRRSPSACLMTEWPDDRATQTTQKSHSPYYTLMAQLSCLRSVSCLRPTPVTPIPIRRSPSACLMSMWPDDRATQTTQAPHSPYYTFITQLSCLRSVSCLRPTSVTAIPVRRSPSACLMTECPDDRATQTSQTTHSTYNTCTPQISRLRSVSGSARGGALQSTQTPHLT